MATVDIYSISGAQLLLNSGKILVRKLNGVSMETDKPIGTWQFNYLSDLKIAFDGFCSDKRPFTSFNFSAKELMDNTSCNGFSATYHMNGNNIRFADPLKTGMFCEGGGVVAFLNMLKKVNKYSLIDNTLTFFTDEVAIMPLQKNKFC